MHNEVVRFLRSITTMGWVRIGMAMVVTTLSVRMAFGEQATPGLVIGCNFIAVAFAIYIEYKNFKTR